jgi:hypothetical protein
MRASSRLPGLIVKDGRAPIDLADEIVRETLVARGGDVVHPRLRDSLGLPAPAGAQPELRAPRAGIDRAALCSF